MPHTPLHVRSRAWLVLLVLAGGAWILARLASGDSSVRGGDGPTLVESGSGRRTLVWPPSFGTQHSVRVGRWPRLDPVREWLPSAQRVLGRKTVLVRSWPPGGKVDGLCLFHQDLVPEAGSAPEWELLALDEHGCGWKAEGERGSHGFPGGSVGWRIFEAYPRRRPEFEVRYVERRPDGTTDPDAAARGFRVRIKNPRPWVGTEWVPQDLPAVATRDGKTVRMVEWVESSPWPHPWLKLAENGVEREEWVPFEIWYEDVTGNRTSKATLCRKEPAWRVTARYGRTAGALSGPDEGWTFHEGDWPAPGQALNLAARREIDGVSVTVWAIGGPGVVRFESTNGWRVRSTSLLPPGDLGGIRGGTSEGASWSQQSLHRSWVALSVRGATRDHRCQVALVNAYGGARVSPTDPTELGDFTVCRFEDVAFTGKVRFVVQRLVDFSWTVKPPRGIEPGPPRSLR